MTLNLAKLRWNLKKILFHKHFRTQILCTHEDRLHQCVSTFCHFSYLQHNFLNNLVTSHLIIPKRTIFGRLSFGHYSVICQPSFVSESSPVPNHIIKPPYAVNGQPSTTPDLPELKNKSEIDGVRRASKIARSILDKLANYLKIGITSEEIDSVVREKTFESGSYPSPFNYRGFPKSCCTSVNNVACHGIPDSRKLENGDIISVDVTVYHEGFHGDCCETYMIGDVDAPGKHLVEVTRKCRDSAIATCGPEVPFSHIGNVVESIARQEGLTVVPAFAGHGIGAYFHGPPDIYHCVNEFPGVMKPGMTFTVEPVIAQGSCNVVILEDGWTAVMVDNGRAAQFEHTILITETGHEILTLLP